MSAAATRSAEPNVTPMIDVLLVMLVIFMLAMQRSAVRLIYAQPPVPPTSATARWAPSIVLEVGPGGRYTLNRMDVPRATLGARLEAVYRGRPEKVLFVRGDPRASYQDVLEAMSVARGAGVKVIGLTKEPTHPHPAQ